VEKRLAKTVIGKPADEVWARVREFGDISWIPDSEKCVVEGDVRKVSRAGWSFELEQRLVEHDDERRTYSYALPGDLDLSSLIGPGKVVRVLNGTLAISPQGPDESVVTWEIETEDFLIPGVHAEYQNALESLKAQLEG
jgi:hypothetical protein